MMMMFENVLSKTRRQWLSGLLSASIGESPAGECTVVVVAHFMHTNGGVLICPNLR